MHPLADIRAAVGLLTALPVGRVRSDARPTAWFAWVGWSFGMVAVGIASLSVPLGLDGTANLVVAALIVCAWGAGTRFLHWDGLADCGDAMWGGDTAARRLEIMRDPRIGAFGVVAIVLVGMLQVSSVAVIVASRAWWSLGAAPVLGRFSASIGAWSLRPARAEGLGAAIVSRPRFVEILVASLAVGATIVAPSWNRVVLLVFACAVAWLVPRMLARRVGGVTGDVLGASVMWVETAVLVLAALTGV